MPDPRPTALALVLIGFAAAHARAQPPGGEPLITDRPDFTESTAAVAPGRVQLEAGYTFTRQSALRAHTTGEPLLRVGVVPDVEARISPGSYTWIEAPVRADGLEDAQIGMKWALADGGAGITAPAAAVLASTTLPTGNEALSADRLQPVVLVALDWTLSERVSLASNVGGASVRDDAGRFMEWAASLALGAGLTDRVGTYAEVFGFAPEDRPGESFLNGGITYLVTPDLQFDVRVGTGLDGPWPNYFTGAGFAWRR